MYLRAVGLAFLLIIATVFIDESETLALAGKAAIATESSPASACLVGRTAPPIGFWNWPAHAHVHIYLRSPDFSESDVSAVRTAVENWDATAALNGSNVHFIFHGLTHETKTGRWEMTIIRKVVFDKQARHFAMLEAHSRRGNQSIDYALMLVDPGVKNTSMLTNVVAHELGHSLGLLDCYQCDSQSTAMGLLSASGGSNGMDGPSVCDQRGVLTTYESLATRPPLVAVAE